VRHARAVDGCIVGVATNGIINIAIIVTQPPRHHLGNYHGHARMARVSRARTYPGQPNTHVHDKMVLLADAGRPIVSSS